MWIYTLAWIIEDWYPKIMDIHVDIRGFLEIHAWICHGFSDQGAHLQSKDIHVRDSKLFLQITYSGKLSKRSNFWLISVHFPSVYRETKSSNNRLIFELLLCNSEEHIIRDMRAICARKSRIIFRYESDNKMIVSSCKLKTYLDSQEPIFWRSCIYSELGPWIELLKIRNPAKSTRWIRKLEWK